MAAYFLSGSLLSKAQRVSRVWVVDNSSLAGISVNIYAVVVPFVLAAVDSGLFLLVFLFVHRWY